MLNFLKPILRIPRIENIPDGYTEEECLGLFVSSSSAHNGLSLCQPVIANSYKIEKLLKKHGIETTAKIMGKSFFPSRFNGPKNKDHPLYVNKLERLTGPNIFTGKFMEIEKFNCSKIENIHDYVKNNGSLYFKISDIKGCINFLNIALRKIEKHYKYSTNISKELQGNEVIPDCPKDLLSLFVCFHDISYSFPIFNKRNVDGMCIEITLSWPESSLVVGAPCVYSRIYIVVSNYKDNLIYVDGEQINNISVVDNDFSTHVLKKIINEKDRRKKISLLIKKNELKTKKKKSNNNFAKSSEEFDYIPSKYVKEMLTNYEKAAKLNATYTKAFKYSISSNTISNDITDTTKWVNYS